MSLSWGSNLYYLSLVMSGWIVSIYRHGLGGMGLWSLAECVLDI